MTPFFWIKNSSDPNCIIALTSAGGTNEQSILKVEIFCPIKLNFDRKLYFCLKSFIELSRRTLLNSDIYQHKQLLIFLFLIVCFEANYCLDDAVFDMQKA